MRRRMKPTLTIMRLLVTPSSVVLYAMNGGISMSAPRSRTTRPATGTVGNAMRTAIPTISTKMARAKMIQCSAVR